ncbi:MAG: hypothetical protein IKD58_03700 [Loktanella sp.]|nr:hypothetical protein [Loktanella sp.]
MPRSPLDFGIKTNKRRNGGAVFSLRSLSIPCLSAAKLTKKAQGLGQKGRELLAFKPPSSKQSEPSMISMGYGPVEEIDPISGRQFSESGAELPVVSI